MQINNKITVKTHLPTTNLTIKRNYFGNSFAIKSLDIWVNGWQATNRRRWRRQAMMMCTMLMMMMLRATKKKKKKRTNLNVMNARDIRLGWYGNEADSETSGNSKATSVSTSSRWSMRQSVMQRSMCACVCWCVLGGTTMFHLCAIVFSLLMVALEPDGLVKIELVYNNNFNNYHSLQMFLSVYRKFLMLKILDYVF